jgi:transposase-like protein
MTPPELPSSPHSRQLHLPLYPEDAIDVSEAVTVSVQQDTVWYFHQGMPLFSHARADHASFQLYTSMLCDNGACKLAEVVRAFKVTSISVKRALKRFRQKGAGAFFVRTSVVRGAPVLTPEVLQRVQGSLDEGLSVRQTADTEGLKRDTVYRAIKSGRLHQASKKKT